jgi:hypothetical protein
MTVIWANCETTVFDEPPCGPWSKRAIDLLFVSSFPVVALYLFRFRNNVRYFGITMLIALGEILAAAFVWFWGGMSVSGFYF